MQNTTYTCQKILLMAKLGNVAASTSTTFTLDHVPQKLGLGFLATGTINKVLVSTDQDGVIVNLNEAAFKALSASFYLTALDTTSDLISIPLASGEIRGTRCTIQVETGAGASGVDVHDISLVESFDKVVYQSTMMNVITNGSAELSKFSKCVILSMGATDVFTYRARTGATSITLTAAELKSISAEQFNNAGDFVVLDNRNMIMDSIMFSPAAERTVVFHRMGANGTTNIQQVQKAAVTNVVNSNAPTGMKQAIVTAANKQAAASKMGSQTSKGGK